uniref:Uncharacterized protein n=1 Tax=Chelonoidis abingdonii TaxID=106734 RepID=A0A8C0HHL3_CHEAB
SQSPLHPGGLCLLPLCSSETPCFPAGHLISQAPPSLRYPKPNISLRSSGQVVPGGAVTIRCECRCRGARFLLSKAGDLDAQYSDPVGDVAEFPILSVSWRDWDLPIWSYPSDPVELVVAGEGPSSPSLLPAPHPDGPSRGLRPDGTLRARLCPDPWAQQTGSLQEGWDGVTGVPQPRENSSRWRFGAEGGGIRAPTGSCRVCWILHHWPQAPHRRLELGGIGLLGYLSGEGQTVPPRRGLPLLHLSSFPFRCPPPDPAPSVSCPHSLSHNDLPMPHLPLPSSSSLPPAPPHIPSPPEHFPDPPALLPTLCHVAPHPQWV